MSSPSVTTVLLPPAKGSSMGGDSADPSHGKCPWRQAATTKLGKIRRPQMGRIQRPLTRQCRKMGWPSLGAFQLPPSGGRPAGVRLRRQCARSGRSAAARLPLAMLGWALACLAFLVLGILTPVDMRYYLGAVPAVAMSAGLGASAGWAAGGYVRLGSVALLAWSVLEGLSGWWAPIG